MVHTGPKFGIVTVEHLEEPIENLTRHTWSLCTGFEYQRLLFLNDSLTEDEDQAYTVARDGRHMHSLHVSWM